MGESKIIELRQYTLKSGQRDVLIELFEKEFIEPQNCVGAKVIGTFRDLDDPDRFVWLRGFESMASRKISLETFYGGSVWAKHRNKANETMLDSDNVLLLNPIKTTVFETANAADSNAVYGIFIYYLKTTNLEDFCNFFFSAFLTKIEKLNVQPIYTLSSEIGENTFPKLPIRNEAVFAWIGKWDHIESLEDFKEDFNALSGLRDSANENLLSAFMQKPEILRLKPTELSALK